MDEARLLQKLYDLEALIAGATTPGERLAADAAREKIRARLGEVARSAPPVEYRFTMADAWSKRLFVALLRRYGLRPYRYRGQRRTTVMVKVPKRFLDETLWPHFLRAVEVLRAHFDEIASKVISSAIDAREDDAEDLDEEPTSPPELGS